MAKHRKLKASRFNTRRGAVTGLVGASLLLATVGSIGMDSSGGFGLVPPSVADAATPKFPRANPILMMGKPRNTDDPPDNIGQQVKEVIRDTDEPIKIKPEPKLLEDVDVPTTKVDVPDVETTKVDVPEIPTTKVDVPDPTTSVNVPDPEPTVTVDPEPTITVPPITVDPEPTIPDVPICK